MDARFGMIITNRDRPEPVRNCLLSLAAQRKKPHWVVIVDFGSGPEASTRLRSLADDFQVSYLRIDDSGPWRQALAFNTGLRKMPEASHIVQLDADMILHPYLLQLTEKVLQSVDVMGCVTSYAPRDAACDAYEGSIASFQDLLRKSKSGVSSAIGGYMVLPREWLLKNRGFDEAYVGWGYEDGDLWLRVQEKLSTYCETTGSFLIHQPHGRQAGASTFEGNPNWEAYQRRKAGVGRMVNEATFGEAPVSTELIQFGIRSPLPDAPTAEIPYPWQQRSPLRRLRDGRLRPHFGSADSGATFLSSRLEKLKQSSYDPAHFSVSVVIPLHNQDVRLVAVTIASLLSQTAPVREIILSDQASANSHSRGYQALSDEMPQVKWVRCESTRENSPARAINAGLRISSEDSTHVLVVDGDICFHPRTIETCFLAEQGTPCFMEGYAHEVPAMVRDFGRLDNIPWNGWSSLAYLDEPEICWHFARRTWLLKAGLYDERKLGRDAMREAELRVRRNRGIRVLALPLDWLLAVRTTHS